MENKTPKKSSKSFIILVIILLVAAGIGIYYYIKSAAYETTDDAQLNGNIFSIRSGLTTYLDTICFRDNQQVRKGDTLLIFDTVALNAKVEQAKAMLENAKASLSVSDIKALAQSQDANASMENALSGKQNVAAAQASLQKAQSDLDRAQELLKIKAMTQQDYDATKTTFEQAKAGYEQAVHSNLATAITSTGLKSQAKAAHHQISAAAALVNEKTAELQLAKEELSHAYILAPCNGIVTKRSVEQGQYVLAGQSLCAVVDEENLWITANFKETQLKNIKPGQAVQISLDAYPNVDLRGEVQSYGGATRDMFSLIPPDNATGNFIKVTQRFPLRISIDSFFETKNKPTVLFPGLSAFVKIKIK